MKPTTRMLERSVELLRALSLVERVPLLLFVAAAPEGRSQRDLAREFVAVGAGGWHAVIEQLSRDGWLVRSPDGDGGSRVHLNDLAALVLGQALRGLGRPAPGPLDLERLRSEVVALRRLSAWAVLSEVRSGATSYRVVADASGVPGGAVLRSFSQLEGIGLVRRFEGGLVEWVGSAELQLLRLVEDLDGSRAVAA